MADFTTVKEYVLELGLAIAEEIPEEEIIIVNDEERGVQNLVVDCEDTVLVIEQLILKVAAGATAETYQRILQMNRDLVFGAFVLKRGRRFAALSQYAGIRELGLKRTGKHNQLPQSRLGRARRGITGVCRQLGG